MVYSAAGFEQWQSLIRAVFNLLFSGKMCESLTESNEKASSKTNPVPDTGIL
jgi:hypothetical protein